MSIIEDPTFRRWIPAQEIMDRWGMEYISFRQLHPPLYAHIQTKQYDYSLSNPMVKNKEGKCTHFRGIEAVPHPYTKEDFKLVFYDFFVIAKFESQYPEIVKNREVSPDLEKDFAVHHPAGNIEHKLPPEQDPPPHRKLTPSQEDKIACREIAKEVWSKYPILDYIHMVKHPDILKIVGKQYKGKRTVRNWLCEVAPKRVKENKRRSLKTKAQQETICRKIGIQI